MSAAHLVVVTLGAVFLSFDVLHPAADLLYANTHRAAVIAGAGRLLNDDLAEFHDSYLPNVHPAATLPPPKGHPLLVPPALCPEGVYEEPPFHVPI